MQLFNFPNYDMFNYETHRKIVTRILWSSFIKCFSKHDSVFFISNIPYLAKWKKHPKIIETLFKMLHCKPRPIVGHQRPVKGPWSDVPPNSRGFPGWKINIRSDDTGGSSIPSEGAVSREMSTNQHAGHSHRCCV